MSSLASKWLSTQNGNSTVHYDTVLCALCTVHWLCSFVEATAAVALIEA